MLVEKRNGSTQEFDRAKLTQSLVSAGLSDEDAQTSAVEVEAWAVEKSAETGSVKSQAIRDKVIAVLGASHPEVADTYRDYTKTPEAVAEETE